MYPTLHNYHVMLKNVYLKVSKLFKIMYPTIHNYYVMLKNVYVKVKLVKGKIGSLTMTKKLRTTKF